MNRLIATVEELEQLPSRTVLIGDDNDFPRVYQWIGSRLLLLDQFGGLRHPSNVLRLYGPLEVVWEPRAVYEAARV